MLPVLLASLNASTNWLCRLHVSAHMLASVNVVLQVDPPLRLQSVFLRLQSASLATSVRVDSWGDPPLQLVAC
eukprot:scaffold227868_cov13-Tisochrysis_lutea.AAC.1